MNWKSWMVGVGLAWGFLGGCTDSDPASLLLVGNVVPKSEGTSCAYKDPDLYYPAGVLDLAVRNDYVFAAHVQNILPATKAINGEDVKTLRPETNQISLEKAVFRFDPVVALKGSPLEKGGLQTKLVLEWELPVQFTMQPDSSIIMPMVAVPRQVKSLTGAGYVQLGSDWQARFSTFTDRYKYILQGVLHITFVGVTAGGSEVRTEEFSYPMELCWGCLLASNFLKAGGETSDDHWRDCSKMQVPTEYKSPCQPGQQEGVHCSHNCQICKNDETVGIGKCDAKFCPPLD